MLSPVPEESSPSSSSASSSAVKKAEHFARARADDASDSEDEEETQEDESHADEADEGDDGSDEGEEDEEDDEDVSERDGAHDDDDDEDEEVDDDDEGTEIEDNADGADFSDPQQQQRTSYDMQQWLAYSRDTSQVRKSACFCFFIRLIVVVWRHRCRSCLTFSQFEIVSIVCGRRMSRRILSFTNVLSLPRLLPLSVLPVRETMMTKTTTTMIIVSSINRSSSSSISDRSHCSTTLLRPSHRHRTANCNSARLHRQPLSSGQSERRPTLRLRRQPLPRRRRKCKNHSSSNNRIPCSSHRAFSARPL